MIDVRKLHIPPGCDISDPKYIKIRKKIIEILDERLSTDELYLVFQLVRFYNHHWQLAEFEKIRAIARTVVLHSKLEKLEKVKDNDKNNYRNSYYSPGIGRFFGLG